MQTYIIRRVLLIIPTLLVASLVVFFLIRSIPGDIVSQMEAQHIGIFTDADEAAIRQRLGLDSPILVQYGRWIGVVPDHHGSFSGLLQGNLGLSLWRQLPVTRIILTRLPVTLEHGALSIVIAVLIAVPIGTYSAIRQDTFGDFIARSFGIFALAVPTFWIGTLVVVFPSLWWGWSPSIKIIKFTDDPLGNLGMFIIPSLVLGMAMAGVTMRMTRTMMLEVLRQDYIRTAWSKGLKERMVILRHALPNALIPVVTIIGLLLPVVVGGSVITEQIFGLPGLGTLLLLAINDRDYTIVSGIMMFVAVFQLLANLVVDLTYGFLNPMVRYK